MAFLWTEIAYHISDYFSLYLMILSAGLLAFFEAFKHHFAFAQATNSTWNLILIHTHIVIPTRGLHINKHSFRACRFNGGTKTQQFLHL